MAAKTTLQHCTHVLGRSGKLPDLGRMAPWFGTNLTRSLVGYKSRTFHGQFQLLTTHRIDVATNTQRFGFLVPMPAEAFQWCIDHMAELYRSDVEVNAQGKKQLVDVDDDKYEEALDQVEQRIRSHCNEAFGELAGLYRNSPSVYTQVDYLADHIQMQAEEIVLKEIKAFNKTVAKPAAPEYNVLEATEQLKGVIAHKHMNSIRSVCAKLKLSVNDYLYALQDVIDNPSLVPVAPQGIHIID